MRSSGLLPGLVCIEVCVLCIEASMWLFCSQGVSEVTAVARSEVSSFEDTCRYIHRVVEQSDMG